MKINSVKFKDKESFDKNKTKANVIAVHEPFGIIVFEDKERVTPDHTKVTQVNEVDRSLDQIATGLAILVAPNLDAARAYLSKNKVVVTEVFHLTNTLFVEVPAFAAFNEFYIALMDSKLFTSVEPDYIQTYQPDADAYTYTGQWHLPNMQAAEAWGLIDGAAYGEVAVLDIACDVDHEDLQGRISSTSWNCVTDAADVRPISENEKHGTPCSGLICAATDNNIGVSSLGNNKLKVQFLHIGYNSTAGGSFGTSDTIITRAINKAIENPNCLAVSMSWGGGGPTSYPLFQNALTSAKTFGRNGKGIPAFASSGNQNNPNFTQAPAIYPMVHAVGASTTSNTRASFSNYGPKTFAAAPGTSCPTTDRMGAFGYKADSNYTAFSGTSCSCPVMAAAAANVILANPSLTESQVVDVLRQACRKTGGYVYDVNGKSAELGYGVINMFNAVTIAKGMDGGDPVPVPVAEYNLFGTIATPASAVQGSSIVVNYSVNIDKAQTKEVIATVQLTFTRPDGSKFVFYTGDVTIPAGQTVVTKTAPMALPNNQSGPSLFSLTIDPNMVIKETNENDNTISTGLTITMANPPAQGLDAAVTIDGYEWLDANRVRIRYTFYNKGTVTITSMKVTHGLVGGFTGTWNRADKIDVGRSQTFASVYNVTSPPTPMPTDYVLTITAVNGVPDNDSTNNTARLQIKK
jgi:hypothetical protein